MTTRSQRDFFPTDRPESSERCGVESRFSRIAQLEGDFGTTIKKGQSVEGMARRSKEFVSDIPEELRRLAMSRATQANSIIESI